MAEEIDVLCAGFACHDLIFSVERHPGPDEKTFARQLFDCGGGPAANAAYAAARLGASCAFAGYLGDDLYGRNHLEEMAQTGIRTDLVVTGDAPTPLSVILVKPDGRRTVINYNRSAAPLAADAIDTGAFLPGVILFDGHQPQISLKLVDFAQRHQIPTVLDAGSRHAGTEVLVGRVDYVVASEVFASQISGQADAAMAARKLHRPGTAVVVTLGAEGLVWRTDAAHGHLAAFEIDAVDTTGAGDAFHGAFATGLARGLPWDSLLRYASAAAALCCCEFGARLGMPDHRAVNNFIQYSDKG